MSLLVEMKRRKVLNAAFVYGVMAWLVLQITDVVSPILDLPAWVAKLVLFLLLGGLPIMLVLAWQFDLTSLGIYREKPWQQNGGDAASGEDKRVLSRAVKCIACLWVRPGSFQARCPVVGWPGSQHQGGFCEVLRPHIV